jgi:hypothetical protein
MEIRLRNLWQVDQDCFLVGSGKPDVLAHVAERAGRDQVVQAVVSMVVIGMVDFLPVQGLESAEPTGMLIPFKRALANALEFGVGVRRIRIVHAPVEALDAQAQWQRRLLHRDAPYCLTIRPLLVTTIQSPR